MGNEETSNRKSDHIELAFDAQANFLDSRFEYEPFLRAHPEAGSIPPVHFASKVLKAPIWISSMTGGAAHAKSINHNLAMACKEFGLGMGLGSCRPLIENDNCLPDFDVRQYMGNQPLFANLGIAQVETILDLGKEKQILELIEKLQADGLILHVNPLQEWLQPEGDRIKYAPIDTIKRLLEVFKAPLIVKEVGQGFGPESLKQLAALPLEAIDFAAQGGTNFSMLENMRSNESKRNAYESIAHIGHNAAGMTDMVIELINTPGIPIKTRGFIVSGGINDFLDGYYHIQRIPYKAIYGQASAFLKYALEGELPLLKYVELQVKGLEMAYNYLQPKSQ